MSKFIPTVRINFRPGVRYELGKEYFERGSKWSSIRERVTKERL